MSDHAPIDYDYLSGREATIVRGEKQQRTYQILGNLLSLDRPRRHHGATQSVDKFFVARDAPNFGIIQMVIGLFLIVALVKDSRGGRS